MTLLEISEAEATGQTVVVKSTTWVTVRVAVASRAGQSVTFWAQPIMVWVEVIWTVRVVKSTAEDDSLKPRRCWKRG